MYSDFDWVELAGGKGLYKLKVKSLDKYLQHHMLLLTALELRTKGHFHTESYQISKFCIKQLERQ